MTSRYAQKIRSRFPTSHDNAPHGEIFFVPAPGLPRRSPQAEISFRLNTRSSSHTMAIATIAIEPPNSTTRR